MDGNRVLLKLSPQGQVTLRRGVREALGNPRHLECWLENGTLMLRPAVSATLAEAEALYGKHGITRDVLAEALRIVRRGASRVL
ncbi:hypothetical protein LPC08_01395 [Roseomonas sp. OT10]|uniref:hypothetical protein n=1 Tax=Roseomonas cutis TaxID=2897332 RepID=UPI001E3D42FE|nr:hypothetical protein [Roseomonas sp. OT10]UFN49329.1 hypothetical protein LPC08_01395 [Roseomonas sp. OT10]